MTRSGQRHAYWRCWCVMALLSVWVLVGGAPVEAQATRYRVTVLSVGIASEPVMQGLREGLAQLGYHEEKNLALTVEHEPGAVSGLPEQAAKIVAATPDLIVTVGTASTSAAKQASTTIPIVFALVGDPLRSGLIASYASSQNNLTGITNAVGQLSGKRLEVLQEIAPGIKRILILVSPQESVAQVSLQFLAEAAPKLGIELLRHDVSSKEDIEQALLATPRGAVDAIYHIPSGLVGAHINLLIHKAREDGIPLVVHETTLVEQGALVSYGAEFRLLGAQAARLVAKILQGATPAELPIQTPERLLLAVNLSTARAIGLDIPHSILERTERVVE